MSLISPKSIYIGNNAVKAVYLGTKRIRPGYPTESIVYKMNADSGGNLYVPIAGQIQNSSAAPYSRYISVDGGNATLYSGTGGSGRSITLSGYTAGTSHTIMITPQTEAYQWACAFGWYNTAGRTYLTDVLYDGSYMGYALNATSTGTYFRTQQYQGCTNLLVPPEEVLPEGVTTIGDYFRYQQYYQCSKLQYAPEEALPSTVTSIKQYYRSSQYNACTQLSEIRGRKDLSIGAYNYRSDQFDGAGTRSASLKVKVLTDIGYSAPGSYTLNNGNVNSVFVPNEYLSNFTSTSSVYPRRSITDSKFVGY